MGIEGTIMRKYKYKITGINMAGKQFESECIDSDLIHAVQKYRRIAFSIDSAIKLVQVAHDEKMGICCIKTME
jgi:hypothetical protein